ncbi:MAG: FdhF/YdeP family oxidoreductase [Myxococcales bacterium]|nr:FdhF/YdeP family oxidoreductase [Myxococcales bacterium]
MPPTPPPSRGRPSLPFGMFSQKPNHYREMLRIGWRNRRRAGYALRVLREGVCDGCALGTSGLSDWTMEGMHLCLVRLNLLELNTMDALEPARLADVEALRELDPRALRRLGRLPVPMRRRRGEPGFTPLSWPQAIEEIGARMGRADPARIACYLTSRGLGNEVYFAAQKAFRYLGSPNVDNAARLCHSPSTAAMKRVLGVAASTCSYRDWYGAKLVIFFGSNPANDQPVAVKYLAEAKKLGTRVLSVNPLREPGMERYFIPSDMRSALTGTPIVDQHYRVATGGDHAFIYAVQKLLLDKGYFDRDFIGEHTSGFGAYRAFIGGLDFDDLVARSGSDAESITHFAKQLISSESVVFVWSMGLTQHSGGTETIEALCCLALSLGLVGRENCGLMPIRGHSGVQGGAEMGAYANVFPGGAAIDEAEAQRLEQLWGFAPPARVGLDTTAMLEAALSGELELLYAVGGNFLDTLPQPAEVERALSRVPTRVHQDIMLNHSMLVEPEDSLYLLPAKTRYEHDGGITQTTTERRVIFSPSVEGHRIAEAREEWKILIDLAKAAKPEQAELIDYRDATAIREDIARSIDFYAPIAGLSKRGDQFQWGGRLLCQGGEFPLPKGRALFVTSEPRDSRTEADFFRLATRRGKQFNSLIQADVDQLTGASRDHVFMNVQDMQRLGLAQDDPVQVQSEVGRVRGRAFAADLTPGNLQMHWPEANPLIDAGRRDDGGKVPDYNAVVQLSRVAGAPGDG